eukprot:3519469-Alexandrium_andersonii.AAC.1
MRPWSARPPRPSDRSAAACAVAILRRAARGAPDRTLVEEGLAGLGHRSCLLLLAGRPTLAAVVLSLIHI